MAVGFVRFGLIDFALASLQAINNRDMWTSRTIGILRYVEGEFQVTSLE